MTLKLLENELVLKYFACHHIFCEGQAKAPTLCMAFNILQAMCEPIKKGESYLYIRGDMDFARGKFVVRDYWMDSLLREIHPWYLRLPDAFQQKRECGKCDECGYDYQRYCRQHTQKPDPVNEENFLKWIADRMVNVYGEPENVDFVLKLRELAKA